MEKASIVLAAEVFALNSRANKDGQLLLVRLVLWILCSNGRADKKTIIQLQQELEQSQDFRSLKFKNIYEKFRKKWENKYETNQIHIFDFKIGFKFFNFFTNLDIPDLLDATLVLNIYFIKLETQTFWDFWICSETRAGVNCHRLTIIPKG